jgi:sugar phosphate isomerase/epimerase
VNWDTANTLAYGDNPIPVLKKIINRVLSVHAADTSTRGELKPVLLGRDLVPFRIEGLPQKGLSALIELQLHERLIFPSRHLGGAEV